MRVLKEKTHTAGLSVLRGHQSRTDNPAPVTLWLLPLCQTAPVSDHWLAGAQERGSVQSDSTSEERLQGEERTAAYSHQQCLLSMLPRGEDVECSRIPISGSPALCFGTAPHFGMVLIRWSQNNVTFCLLCDPCLIPWIMVANLMGGLGCSELFIINRIDIELSVNHANSSFHPSVSQGSYF